MKAKSNSLLKTVEKTGDVTLMLPVDLSPETVLSMEIEVDGGTACPVKLIAVWFAPFTVTDLLAGVNVYPGRLGVTA